MRLRANHHEIERALHLLVDDGATFEIRAIEAQHYGGEAILSGYFRDVETAAAEVARMDKPSVIGWYVTINPCKSELYARRADRIVKVGKDATTKDQHIENRRRFYIDIDPDRASGISSTDAQHAAAMKLASAIAAELVAMGWPEPSIADSGNGAHLIYVIDIPAEDNGLIGRVLKAAAAKWSGTVDGIALKVDVSTCNPSRITKLYGTPARKGDDVAERPHRMSAVISSPEEWRPVPRDLLESLAAAAPHDDSKPHEQRPRKSKGRSKSRNNVAEWLAQHEIAVLRVVDPWTSKDGAPGVLYELAACPFNPEHGDRGETWVAQFASGALAAGCPHDSCKSIGWDWAELREKYDGPSGNSSGPGPRELAARYIAEHATHADGVMLRRWRGDWWRWSADRGCYVGQTEDQIAVALYRALGLEKRSDVADVQAAIMAEDRVLIDGAELGTWLDGPPPPSVGALDTGACRNGLVHLPTGKLTPTTPRYFTTTALPLDYDEHAPIPRKWLDFLRQLWPEDEASIAFLQEWIGYLLTPDTRQHKIAYLIGKPRSGKGTIGRVITALLGGKANVAAPSLAQFATNFGMWPLVGKLAAVVGDARLSGRSDVPLVVERLLSISGEDPQNVDRKHRDAWNGILPTRITIISNEIPRFVDASPALAERSIMLSLKRSFLGEEDTELTEKLIEELPGILLWAIEGWRRLRERGRFNPPESSKRMVRQMADLASPVGAWVRARCETGSQDPGNWIRCEDAYADFKTWCGSNGYQHVPSLVIFGRDIQTVTGCERTRLSSKFPNGPRPWVYEGLSLKTEDAEDAA